MRTLFSLLLLASVGVSAQTVRTAPQKSGQPPVAKANGGKPGAGKPIVGKGGPMAPKDTPKVTPKPAAKSEPALSAVNVTVRAMAEVPGVRFTLSEIADIQGTDKELVAQLGKVEVGTSPLPGMSRNVTPGDITVRLRGARLESPRVVVTAPPVIRVTRAKNDVPPTDLLQAALPIAQKAVEHLPDATLEPQPLSQNITLPTGRVVLIAGAHRGEPEIGTIHVPVSLNVDGKAQQTIEVAFRVRRRMEVVVVNRTVEVNETLEEADVSLVKMELPSGFTKPVTELKEAVGKRAKRRLMANQPISTMNLEIPPAISANARVTIEFIIGPVRIIAPGIAREAGAIGDTIRVYAPDTRKEVAAVIVDSRIVRISDETE
jgi:flagellar basal body P-ring formation protein FlgA